MSSSLAMDWVMVAFLATCLVTLWGTAGFAVYVFWQIWRNKQ